MCFGYMSFHIYWSLHNNLLIVITPWERKKKKTKRIVSGWKLVITLSLFEFFTLSIAHLKVFMCSVYSLPNARSVNFWVSDIMNVYIYFLSLLCKTSWLEGGNIELDATGFEMFWLLFNSILCSLLTCLLPHFHISKMRLVTISI